MVTVLACTMECALVCKSSAAVYVSSKASEWWWTAELIRSLIRLGQTRASWSQCPNTDSFKWPVAAAVAECNMVMEDLLNMLSKVISLVLCYATHVSCFFLFWFLPLHCCYILCGSEKGMRLICVSSTKMLFQQYSHIFSSFIMWQQEKWVSTNFNFMNK